MKKSIQTRIILLILVGILSSSLLIGGIGLYSFGTVLASDTINAMNLTCAQKAEELNGVLARVEESTDIMGAYSIENLESAERLSSDEVYRDEYLDKMSKLALIVASETEGAVSIYIRLNPELAPPDAGFRLLKNEQTGEYETVACTDLSKYSPDDETVGWYYDPIEAGHGVWMEPYTESNGIEMTSYIIPIYLDGQLIGITGIDIYWSYIIEKIDQIEIYESGYAFLVDENFNITYSKEFEKGTDVTGFSDELRNADKEELTSMETLYECVINGEERLVAFSMLENGKIMAVMVPRGEVTVTTNQLILRLILISAVICAAFVFISIQIAKTMIRPLQALNEAAKEVANGNLQKPLDISSEDEIGTLAKSLSETARQLQIKIDYINNLAYTDKLTDTKNNTAYIHDVAVLKSDIQHGTAEFSIFIIDINGLKKINDTYGHEQGNRLIIKASQIATDIFGQENLYRIGGDEFAILLRDATEELCDKYKKVFTQTINSQKGDIWVSAAIGSATYEKEKDTAFEQVFNRADEEMYNNKVRMKALGKNSKIIEE